MRRRWAVILAGGLGLAALVYGGVYERIEGASPTAGAGVFQLVEMRGKEPVCRGVIIQLKHAKFRPVIEADQITVTDDKYARSQKEFMEWKVEQDGRRLTMRLRPEFKDFGSGNHLHITIQTSAFIHVKAPVGVVAWSLSTDVL